jgi:hypothetical protein
LGPIARFELGGTALRKGGDRFISAKLKNVTQGRGRQIVICLLENLAS